MSRPEVQYNQLDELTETLFLIQQTYKKYEIDILIG